MSTNYKGFTVTFEQDVSEEYMDMVKTSIEIMKGVIDVTPSKTNMDDHMNRESIRYELINKLYKTLKK